MDFLQNLIAAGEKQQINIDYKIRALAFLPDTPPRIVSGEENTVHLRTLAGNSLRGERIDFNADVFAVATSRDGHWIVVGSADGFGIWNKAERALVKHAIRGVRVRTIDISSDSLWVATGSDGRTVDMWDISTGTRRPGFDTLKHEYNVVAVKFCPCGERIATATLFGSIRIFATSSGQKLLTIPVSVRSTLSSPTITLAWCPNLTRMFAVSQGQIKCVSSEDGSLIFQWPTRGVTHPSSVVLSPNGKVIAYSVNDAVVLRDTTTHEQIGGTLQHDGIVSCIAFSPAGDHLVVGADRKFTVWNLRKLIVDTTDFSGTISHCDAESCVNHKPGAGQKKPPSTFLLPLMSIDNDAVKPWLHSYLDYAENVLSTKIDDCESAPDYNAFANRSLIRAQLGKGNLALEDAKESLRIQPSPIGAIAKTIALILQGDQMLAKQGIPEVLEAGHSDQDEFLLQVIQSILACLSGEYDKETSNVIKLSQDQKERQLLLLVQANMHLSEKNFGSAMESFKNTGLPAIFPHDETLEMQAISFIFGWKFSGLSIQIQQRKCESLLHKGEPEAADHFLEVKTTYCKEIMMHIELSDWSSDFRSACIERLQDLGDQALKSEHYHEAIRQYTAVEPLLLDTDLQHALLLKRSEAHEKIGPENWQQALQDADKAIKLNSSSPWGYDRRHAVLYKYHSYHEAAEALDQLVLKLTYSTDAKSTELRDLGVDPGRTRKIVLEVAEDILARPRPHILIDTKSGHLCDKQKQTEAFKASLEYKGLILSPTAQVSANDAWKENIRLYFCYSTLSHTWESLGEPEFREVEKISLNDLKDSFPNKKLQTYCRKTYELGYWWAWSDTCCINKAEREILDVSLRSMYRWYSGSSLTIVHLRGVRNRLKVDVDMLFHILDELLKDFVDCRWNKRAWTLQEYFASVVIHFYTEDWEPYLPIEVSDTKLTNHKDIRAIQRGMELVTGLDAVRLAALKPGSQDARQKLRLASAREATRREDVAYSLLGIFKVTIEAIYGDDEVPRALGRLLGALLTQSADVTILAWTGKPSEYNTCLPAEITVYRESEFDHVPQPFEEVQLTAPVSAMLSSLSSSDIDAAVKLLGHLMDLPPPELHHGRLKLPCIWFQLQAISPDLSNPNSYTATVPLLGRVELKTTEDLPSFRNMVLVHPWFRYLLDSGIPMAHVARRESASKLVVALRQPFGALLLAWNSTSRDYQRVATDQLIRVNIPEDVSPGQLLENMGVLYVR